MDMVDFKELLWPWICFCYFPLPFFICVLENCTFWYTLKKSALLISQYTYGTPCIIHALTMCDFHDFDLIFSGQMHCLLQRLKSTFEIFSNGGCLKGTRSAEKISNVDFSL